MSFDKAISQAVIATERFDLRPLRVSDQGLVGHYMSDKRVACMTATIPHPLPPGAAEGQVRRAQAADRTEDLWVIDGTKADQSEVMGVIQLERMDRGQSEISYWIAPPFWNTHLASEAVEAMVAANPQANCTMFASVFQDNAASARVLTNCGFEYIGDAETFSVARNATVATWTYLKRLA